MIWLVYLDMFSNAKSFLNSQIIWCVHPVDRETIKFIIFFFTLTNIVVIVFAIKCSSPHLWKWQDISLILPTSYYLCLTMWTVTTFVLFFATLRIHLCPCPPSWFIFQIKELKKEIINNASLMNANINLMIVLNND